MRGGVLESSSTGGIETWRWLGAATETVPQSAFRIPRFRLAILRSLSQPNQEPSQFVLFRSVASFQKKGTRRLVEACRLLDNQGLDFRCTIIGGGPEHLPLRQLIEARGLDRIVELAGPKSQTEIVELLAQSQIFAFPGPPRRSR